MPSINDLTGYFKQYTLKLIVFLYILMLCTHLFNQRMKAFFLFLFAILPNSIQEYFLNISLTPKELNDSFEGFLYIYITSVILGIILFLLSNFDAIFKIVLPEFIDNLASSLDKKVASIITIFQGIGSIYIACTFISDKLFNTALFPIHFIENNNYILRFSVLILFTVSFAVPFLIEIKPIEKIKVIFSNNERSPFVVKQISNKDQPVHIKIEDIE
ncbi:hypothetical protein [Isobaculum melis]|uniref:Uncharacterized protein n=1 Tax=Isobaculum melis TaxID=142588 RepID=A0A1H9TPG8_9LACT|nr:hypothetical protein [Isobaculum melis]SER98958.1 hypothetical protein SAMN04488559_11536 [Isobaculum melis]